MAGRLNIQIPAHVYYILREDPNMLCFLQSTYHQMISSCLLVYCLSVYLPALHSMRVTEAKLAWAITKSPVLKTALGTEEKVYTYLIQDRSLEQGPYECGWNYGNKAMGTK